MGQIQGAKLLIVDDDPDALSVLRYMLTERGFRVVLAYGADDAWRKLKKDRFDLVITDLSMPGVSGMALIQAIRSDPDIEHLPIVVVTAYLWDQICQSATELGTDGLVPKPFDSEKLFREVDRCLRERSPFGVEARRPSWHRAS